MTRAARLLDIVQVLRRHRRPVTGAVLAEAVGVSLRTLYRDIATLRAQGAAIEGEAGLGFVLRPGFLLPPLMFTEDEIEALVLGSRWVASRTDDPLGRAAGDALAKIAAVLPAPLRETLDATSLLIAPPADDAAQARWLPMIRPAIRLQHRLRLTYADGHGQTSTREVWPLAIGFFDHARVLIAWCVLRGGYRHFRTDRICDLTTEGRRYPGRREALLRDWRRTQGIAQPT